MSESNQMLKRMRAALERHPQVNLHTNKIVLRMDDGLLNVDGEVDDIAVKRIVLQVGVGLFGADHIRERLRIKLPEPVSDGAIAKSLRDSLTQELALQHLRKRVGTGYDDYPLDTAGGGEASDIEVTVKNGNATLEGSVANLMMKRLVEVLAWWTPGVSCVKNRIHVVPNEEDSDDEINDAVRMVLEKDPFLDAGQISIRVADSVVTLDGLVPSADHSRMASQDAWIVPGVHGVVNKLQRRVPGLTD